VVAAAKVGLRVNMGRTEVIQERGPWRGVEHVEFETLDWVDWFNTERLLGPIGHMLPAEFEELHDHPEEAPALVAGLR